MTSLITWCLLIAHAYAQLEIECVTVDETSTSWSGTEDDAYRRAVCPDGYARVGCGIKTKTTDDNVDGAMPSANPGDCKAYNGHGGPGVAAVARCCKIVNADVDVALTCSFAITSDWTSAYSQQVQGCNDETETVTDCTVHSKWKQLRTVYGPDASIGDTYNTNKCVGDTASTKKKTAAICCSLSGDDASLYELECKNYEDNCMYDEDMIIFGCYAKKNGNTWIDSNLYDYYITDEFGSHTSCRIQGGQYPTNWARCCKVVKISPTAKTIRSNILSSGNIPTYALLKNNKILLILLLVFVMMIGICIGTTTSHLVSRSRTYLMQYSKVRLNENELIDANVNDFFVSAGVLVIKSVLRSTNNHCTAIKFR